MPLSFSVLSCSLRMFVVSHSDASSFLYIFTLILPDSLLQFQLKNEIVETAAMYSTYFEQFHGMSEVLVLFKWCEVS